MPPRDYLASPSSEPAENLTRRRLLAAIPGVVILVGGASCGDDDDSGGTPTADGTGGTAVAATPSLSATAAARTRAIDTARGKVEIPTKPERVVCVVNYAMQALFSLGYKPAGVPDGFATSVLPADAATYTAAAKVGPWNQIDLEKVAGLKPDLILGLDIEWNTPIYDNLTAVAPTALFALPGTSAWEDVTQRFADAVGLSAEMGALKQHYLDRAASFKKTYATALAKTRIVIANGFQGGWVVWYPDSSGAQVLQAAGVQFASAAAGKTGNYAERSLEETSQLADADVVLMTAGYDLKVSAGSTAFQQQETFKALPAAKAGHVFPVANLFPMSYTQAIGLLDEFEAILKKVQAS